MRDGKLNGEEFDFTLEARVVAEAGIEESNERPQAEG
jgi:hypothetical protein